MFRVNRRVFASAFLLSVLLCLLDGPLLSAQPQARQETTLPLLKPITWEELQRQIGASPLVTLHAAKMPLGEALEKLNAQLPAELRVPLPLTQRKPTTLTADYEMQPLWLVARDIQQKTGLNPDIWGAPDRFLRFFNDPNSFSALAGPCLLVLRSAQAQNSLDFNRGENADREALSLSGQIHVDPRLRWIYRAASVRVNQASDENGQSLAPENVFGGRGRNVMVGPGWGALDIALQPPAQRGAILKQLRGTLYGTVAVASEQWEIADVLNAKNIQKTIAFGNAVLQLALQGVQATADGYQVTLKTTRNKNGGGQVRLSTGEHIQLNSSLYHNIRLLDAAGRDLKPLGRSSSASNSDQGQFTTATVAFTTESDKVAIHTGPPVRLLLQYDTDWRELAVPFEFKDIPLP